MAKKVRAYQLWYSFHQVQWFDKEEFHMERLTGDTRNTYAVGYDKKYGTPLKAWRIDSDRKMVQVPISDVLGSRDS